MSLFQPNQRYQTQTATRRSAVIDASTQNSVLRKTYTLLSLTLIFAGFTAALSMAHSVMINPILTLVVYIGLLFGVHATSKTPLGIVLTFALTGFLGWTLGPILNMYLTQYQNGSQLIMMALGATGAIFAVLSLIGLNAQRDFSQVGRFCMAGAVVALIAIVVNLFLHLPALQLALSVIIAIISGGFILWQTNAIVRGGETNHVTATVLLFVSIFNLFLTLLQLLGAVAGRD